jgi:hypothetical protein
VPLFTVLNPTQAVIAGNGGPYPAFSRRDGVNLNNNQAGQLVGDGLVVMPNGGNSARAAFALLAALTPGLSTPQQRETYRLKAGLQEWQDLLRLLRSVD